MELKGAAAIVTGGGSGIGRAIALALAAEGAAVAVAGRRIEPLRETAALIEGAGGVALALCADVRRRDQVEALARETLARFGRIDLLCNNAGVAWSGGILEQPDREWEETIATNLNGPRLAIQAVLPAMRAQRRGMIVNVASVLGLHGKRNLSAYCASKFGLIGLTAAAADELKAEGIEVYALCPGASDTDLHRSLVGEEQARFAMPPALVAQKLLALVRGEIKLPPGGTLVVAPTPAATWRSRLQQIANSLPRPWKAALRR